MLCSAKGILLLYLGQFCSPFPGVSPGTWPHTFPFARPLSAQWGSIPASGTAAGVGRNLFAQKLRTSLALIIL